MSARVDSAWADGFAIERGDGKWYGGDRHPEEGNWVGLAGAAVWRNLSAAAHVINKLDPRHSYRVKPAQLVNGRTVLHRVEPAPPPPGKPLDETTAPVHYEGDTGSV